MWRDEVSVGWAEEDGDTSARPGPVQSGRHALIHWNYLIAESLHRLGAHFAESSNREARPRDLAPFDQP
jgi:hypothetical protein